MAIYDRLDEIEENVLSELKDFQQHTVERIDYLFRKGQKRILVSDEVGLGKTLIARGTIAKFAKLRKDEGDDLVKVVYICSNASIAQQNLDKLRIVNELKAEDSNTSRLSMQHLNIFNQENDENVLNRYIQLIPLTPQTSFKITNSQGTMDERALIYVILKRLPQFKRISGKLSEFLRFNVSNWDWLTEFYDTQVEGCDEKSNGEYLKYMIEETTNRLNKIRYGNKSLMDALRAYCRKEDFSTRESRLFIIQLRTIFSDISLDRLEPDLIIMDEFQRFKYLLNTDLESELGRLTTKFFNSKDVRILMLSATPYKMYSTLDEIDETQVDEHYKEFFDVINFLNICKKDREKFNTIWNNYSIELKEFGKGKTSLIEAKNLAEAAMFKNICRTERITESQVGDIIDDSDKNVSLEVFKEDIRSYMEVQNLLEEIGFNNSVPIDYIKSTPYLMSFMKNYQLKRKIERYFKRHKNEVTKMKKSTFFLNRADINNYRKIPFNHARLNHLMDKVLEDHAELLLWIPPSKEYYPSEGVFKNIDNFSKTLIFSSWEMVPRMISSLVSYEIERKTIGRLMTHNPKIKYFLKNRYPSPRITFQLREGIPAQMNLLSLIYPSKFLADIYNPIECLNNHLSLESIEDMIKSKIRDKLDKFEVNDSVREDYRWYYLAPILLDLEYDIEYTEDWFDKFEDHLNEINYNHKGFRTHFDEFFDQFDDLKYGYDFNGAFEEYDSSLSDEYKLGRKPDDLIDILCDLAIASPANCIYRSYQKELSLKDNIENYTHLASVISRTFLNSMNSSEAIAAIELACGVKSEEAYWKDLLKYSKQGNLQAVFDEYVHLLSNGLDKNNENRIYLIHYKFLEAMDIRITAYDVDTYNSFRGRIKGTSNTHNNLRTHFAVSFTKGKSDGKDVNRKKTVRDAFNSPFRPFVLASTSIGQEGLDFHNYCRRIVHWNLPSNPIDLEQREGRINRFECLAIRQNIAKRYGNIPFKKDIWDEMFIKAREIEKLKSRTVNVNGEVNTCSDLIPYWGVSYREDMVKIERIVPMYPFSRDEAKYERLIKILSLYRLTLGQARQEELLDTKLIDYDFEDVKDLFINLSPFYRKKDLDEEFCNEQELIESIDEIYIEPVKGDYRDNLDGDKDLVLTVSVDDESNFVSESNIDYKWVSSNLDHDLIEGDGEVSSNLDHDLIEGDGEVSSNLDHDLIEGEKEKSFSEDDSNVSSSNDNTTNSTLIVPTPVNITHCFNCGIEFEFKNINFCYVCGQDLRANKPKEVHNQDIQFKIVSNLREINKYITKNKIKPKRRYEYWKTIKERLDKEGIFDEALIDFYKPWYMIPIKGVRMDVARFEMLVWDGFIEVKLFVANYRWNDPGLYEFLYKFHNIFENQLGFKLNWNDTGNHVHISIYTPIDMNDENLWKNAREWHIFMFKKFKEVFSDKIINFLNNNPAKLDNELRTQYWDEFDKKMDYTSLFPVIPPHKDSHYLLAMEGIGFNVARIELHSYLQNVIKTGLRIPKNTDLKLFHYLKRDKENIENELGFELNWVKKNNPDIEVKYPLNIQDKDNWDEALKWHVETAKKFDKVFTPRIKEFYKSN